MKIEWDVEDGTRCWDCTRHAEAHVGDRLFCLHHIVVPSELDQLQPGDRVITTRAISGHVESHKHPSPPRAFDRTIPAGEAGTVEECVTGRMGGRALIQFDCRPKGIEDRVEWTKWWLGGVWEEESLRKINVLDEIVMTLGEGERS